MMELALAALLNKQVAAGLGISEIAVKPRRHQVIEKIGAESLAELVRMAERLEIPAAKD